MRIGRFVLGAGLCAWASTLLLAASASAQVTINVNTWVGPNHLLVADTLMPFCKDVEGATQGRVTCNLLSKAVAAPQGYPSQPSARGDGAAGNPAVACDPGVPTLRA